MERRYLAARPSLKFTLAPVTVISGLGGVYAERSGDPNLANVPYGASLWTFALFDK